MWPRRLHHTLWEFLFVLFGCRPTLQTAPTMTRRRTDNLKQTFLRPLQANECTTASSGQFCVHKMPEPSLRGTRPRCGFRYSNCFFYLLISRANARAQGESDPERGHTFRERVRSRRTRQAINTHAPTALQSIV